MYSSNRTNNTTDANDPLSLSAIVNETSNFALERYIRQAEMDICTQHPNFKGSPDICACVLSGAKDSKTCIKGFNDVRKNFNDMDIHPFEPLAWCVKNVESMSGSNIKDFQDSWLLGCINGVRK
jgi:hypothetical protein